MDMHFDGVIFQSHVQELRRRAEHPHPPFCILDVRDPADYRQGHVPGAVPASPADLAAALPAGTSPATEFFIVGADPDDGRVREASLALGAHGARRRVEVPGGVLEWRQAGYPVERGDHRERAA